MIRTLLILGLMLVATETVVADISDTEAGMEQSSASVFVPMSDSHLEEMQTLLNQMRLIQDTQTRYKMLQTYLGSMFTKIYSSEPETKAPAQVRPSTIVVTPVAPPRPAISPGFSAVPPVPPMASRHYRQLPPRAYPTPQPWRGPPPVYRRPLSSPPPGWSPSPPRYPAPYVR